MGATGWKLPVRPDWRAAVCGHADKLERGIGLTLLDAATSGESPLKNRNVQ